MSSTHLTTPHAVRARTGARRASAARATAATPWEPVDRLVTGLVIAVGVALILIAWIGASGTTAWDTQTRWTALSIFGVVVVCLGVGIWLFHGFARVRSEARWVRRQVAARLRPTIADDISSGWGRVTVAGMAHHHRPDCLLIAGKPTHPADESALKPCGVCA